MKLTKLNIKQFRGVSDFECEFGDGLNVIKGRNGIGKTTILDSIMWLLCDETFTYGKQNDDNKNKNNHKQVIEVTGTFVKEDGGELNLKRTYFEKWNVGEDDVEEFDRIINKFEINGASYKLTEYLERIRNEIGIKYDTKVKGINLLRMVLDYSYFGSLDYKISRKFIEEILGVVSDKEILAQEKFEPIKDVVIAQCGDDTKIKSTFKNEFEKASANVEAISTQIASNEKLVNKEQLSEYKELLENKQELFSSSINGDSGYLALNKSFEELDKTIQDVSENSNKEILNAKKEIEELITKGNSIVKQIENAKNKITTFTNNITNANNFIKYITETINKYKNDLAQVEKEEFAIIKCPECGFQLNGNEKGTWQKEHDNSIASLKAQISEQETKVKGQQKLIKSCEKEIEVLNEEIDKYNSSLEEMRKTYEVKKADLESLTKKQEENVELEKLLEQKQTKQQEINDYVNTYNLNKQNKLLELQAKITNCENAKRLSEANEKLKEDLKTQRRIKATAELKMSLLEDFKNVKLQLTKDNTKRVFPNIDFEMLYVSPTTNSLTNCCYAKQGNVEFNGVNSGNKYLLGIEVLEDIKRALNVTEDLPLLFDKFADLDSENLKKCRSLTNAQFITTFVTDENEIVLTQEEE